MSHPYQNLGQSSTASFQHQQDLYPPSTSSSSGAAPAPYYRPRMDSLGHNPFADPASSSASASRAGSPYMAGAPGYPSYYGNSNNNMSSSSPYGYGYPGPANDSSASQSYLPSNEALGPSAPAAGTAAAANTTSRGGGGVGNRQQQQQQQQKSAWMEGGQEPAKTAAWKKWSLIIGVPLIIAAAVAGGIAGWKLSSNKDGNGGSSSGSGSSSSSGDSTTVTGNPSKFKKDSNLKQSFYAMAYSPSGAILPDCGATLPAVQKDMQLLSQLTTRIRTYGSDCNASELVMQAIQDTKVNMTVWLGIYVDTDDTIWQRQRNTTLDILQRFGADNIEGITVGNEFLLNSDGAASAYTSIENKVAQFKDDLESLNLGKTLPVGTADAGSMITASLASKVDYVMANVHPWFGGVPIDDAAGWTWEWMETNVVAVSGNTPAYIAETGWPSQSMSAANATLGGAVAGVPELQEFLDTYICQANANQSVYFYFEPFDEPWKQIYGGVEPYWGLFDKDRNLKNITLPDCAPGNY